MPCILMQNNSMLRSLKTFMTLNNIFPAMKSYTLAIVALTVTLYLPCKCKWIIKINPEPLKTIQNIPSEICNKRI